MTHPNPTRPWWAALFALGASAACGSGPASLRAVDVPPAGESKVVFVPQLVPPDLDYRAVALSRDGQLALLGEANGSLGAAGGAFLDNDVCKGRGFKRCLNKARTPLKRARGMWCVVLLISFQRLY